LDFQVVGEVVVHGGEKFVRGFQGGRWRAIG